MVGFGQLCPLGSNRENYQAAVLEAAGSGFMARQAVNRQTGEDHTMPFSCGTLFGARAHGFQHLAVSTPANVQDVL